MGEVIKWHCDVSAYGQSEAFLVLMSEEGCLNYVVTALSSIVGTTLKYCCSPF